MVLRARAVLTLAAVRERLSSLVYAPPAGGACTKLPLELTKADVLRRGAQVVIVSGCGEGRQSS